MAARVLIVEDEAAIAELIAVNLRHAGFLSLCAADADAARREVERVLPDLTLVDWMLPRESGLSLVRGWRAEERTRLLPIIMLTARDGENDKVAGLDAGADDYIVKPFSVKELLARVRALLRRRAPETKQETAVIGGLSVDPARHRVLAGDAEVPLGPTEFRLLNLLIRFPGVVFTRAQLLDRVWGDRVFIEERTVDVHIRRLREALEPVARDGCIGTVRGVGYRFEPGGAGGGKSP
jgi:two-component system phosphate regulon response regulator PhoB